MTKHPRFFPSLLLVCVVALGAILVDATHQRHARETLARETTRTLGLPDLALSSTARWLRHGSQAEPAAATADGPYALDVEPAGGVLLPTRSPLDGETRNVHRAAR